MGMLMVLSRTANKQISIEVHLMKTTVYPLLCFVKILLCLEPSIFLYFKLVPSNVQQLLTPKMRLFKTHSLIEVEVVVILTYAVAVSSNSLRTAKAIVLFD